MSMHPHAKYFHAFNLFNERIGPMRFKKLTAYFGSLKKAWQEGGVEDFVQAGLEPDLAQEIVSRRPQIDLEQEAKKLAKEEIGILTILDENYPKLLKEIYDAPYIMYIKGEIRPADEFALSIVGTRRLSSYGQQAASHLAGDLARAGLTIVSGLARGIDTLAHLAALEQKGRTIAIVGSGLDGQSLFPPANRRLVQQIACQGAALSEYPIGAFALKHHFPARNRLISGLSLGTLIIEAPEKSGALLTARHALEQNREVFALPGSIYSPNSLGPNNLIKMGAKLVTNGQDILDELNLKNLTVHLEARQVIADTPQEALILKIVAHEPIHVDKIAQGTKLDIATVNATLILMEMKGKVRNLGGMQYVLAR